jgi:hypothetical protein
MQKGTKMIDIKNLAIISTMCTSYKKIFSLFTVLFYLSIHRKITLIIVITNLFKIKQ